VFNNNAKSYGAGLAVGGTGVFGDLQVARSDIESLNSSSFLYGASAG
jgi:hypothetical protein